MKSVVSILTALALAACASGPSTQATAASADPHIVAAVNGDWRSAEDRARDQYRHPAESLAFWELRPEMTIVEIAPGQGWWTRILAPYAHATGGRYIAGSGDLGAPTVSNAARESRAAFLRTHGDEAIYGRVEVVDFSMRAGLALPDESADFILVARSFHNWNGVEGATDRFVREFARVLRPGGVLAVEAHRAAPGSDAAVTGPNGYLPESHVIEAVERAGLVLAARSEINANTADTRDHPFGVWTLPPTLRSAPLGQPADPTFDSAPYEAIGESDRMTLRFVKPD